MEKFAYSKIKTVYSKIKIVYFKIKTVYSTSKTASVSFSVENVLQLQQQHSKAAGPLP